MDPKTSGLAFNSLAQVHHHGNNDNRYSRSEPAHRFPRCVYSRATTISVKVMEKIPAACALGWSIDLEKSLRSRKPDKCIQAIDELGSRLELWNSDSEISTAAYTMFSLIPCEDKFFLNAIFLRLIDAFRLGHKQIKNIIVALFLRMRRKTGIMTKDKLENYLQLLSKVKQVYDDGDAEERALALTLFGCWPYLIKDCADVRYIVLASLVSSDALEVKAGLFAAGCLSELSDHFGFIFLEVLATAVLTECKSRDIKLYGARSFSKLWNSFKLANKAHKTGSRLLKDSDGDDFSALMLISLTRIASKWALLVPAQIDLLALFLSEEKSLHLQLVSLRCHHLILARGACYLLPNDETLNKLFSILNALERQPMHLHALKLFHKIFQITVSTIPVEGITNIFHKLLEVVTNMLKSAVFQIRFLAVRILVDSCINILGRVDSTVEPGNSIVHLTISSILDRIILIVNTSCMDIQEIQRSEVPEVKSLFGFLFNLVQTCPQISCMLVKKIILFIDEFIKIVNKRTASEQKGFSDQKMIGFGCDDKALVESNTLVFVSKIVVSCMYTLDENDNETKQVLHNLKRQIEHVCHCGLFGHSTCLTYVLLLHGNFSIFVKHEKIPLNINSSFPSRDSIVKFDLYALDFAKSMLERNSYYPAYKAGKSAVCHGAWSTAAFIFEKLATKVQSAPYSSWIRLLWQFSFSERQLQLFLLSEQGTCIVPSSQLDERGDISLSASSLKCIQSLLIASNTLFAAKQILETFESRHSFTFQRWFLNLKAKVLKLVVDVIKLLSYSAFVQDFTGPRKQMDTNILHSCKTQSLLSSIHTSIEVSCQMNKLAQQFDLLLTSFMVMDFQSRITISELALRCSLIAFTVGFSFLVPEMNHSGIFVQENQQESIYTLLVNDLIGRLKPTDIECRKNLMFLLKLKHTNKDKSYKLHELQNNIPRVTLDAVCLNELCAYSISEILNTQKDLAVQCNVDTISQIINKNSTLCLNILSKLMLIPFRTPKQFFRTRSFAFSELFVTNEDSKTVFGSSILSGEQLPLNLCLQIRNLCTNIPNKVYCIITCQAQSQNSKNQPEENSEFERINDMTDLDVKLWKYVTGCEEIHSPHSLDSSTVNEYVTFKLNERGQGFTTCLLDVSRLSSGSYRMKWHIGFIDDGGSYCTLLSLNAASFFNIMEAK